MKGTKVKLNSNSNHDHYHHDHDFQHHHQFTISWIIVAFLQVKITRGDLPAIEYQSIMLVSGLLNIIIPEFTKIINTIIILRL